MAAFHLFQELFGWRFLLQLTLCSCFSSSASSRNLFTQLLSWRKYSHIPHKYGSFPSFSTFFHDTPSCPPPLSTTRLSAAFACKELLRHFWHKLVVHASSPSFTTTNASCQQLTDRHNETRALAERSRRSVRRSSLPHPHIP